MRTEPNLLLILNSFTAPQPSGRREPKARWASSSKHEKEESLRYTQPLKFVQKSIAL